MRIMKFGGTSVRDAERIERAAAIVRDGASEEPVAVVVSALGGVTDDLVGAARAAAREDPTFREAPARLRERHLEVADRVASGGERDELERQIEERLQRLEKVLEGVSLVGECSPRSLDKVLSTGELLSAPLMAACLRRHGLPAEACDARRLIVTDDNFGAGRVRFDDTYERTREFFSQRAEIQVVTGFVAATEAGETTTLGRGGSDYTAALLGAALDASRVEIWTDVDGVMSADPRRVPEAFSIECLSFDELLELSHFGAKVIYAPTVHPARSRDVQLLIRNTLNPSFPGTRVMRQAPPSKQPIRGLATIPRVHLLQIQGDGLIGMPGSALRVFRALAEARINVMLISQASSEHSICLAIDPAQGAAAIERIRHEFRREIESGALDEPTLDPEVAILAAVGEEMCRRPGISARLFGALGKAGVNVRAIAQGSSELNISIAVAESDETRALQAVHRAFFESELHHLGLLGVGTVGGAVLERIAGGDGPWSLSLLANSRVMRLRRRDLDRAAWSPELLADSTLPAHDLDGMIDHLAQLDGLRVLVDCTASDDLAPAYTALIERGVNVVTANKKPLAGSLESWDAMQAAMQRSGSGRIYFESTVGAGLPVIRTIVAQLESGDRLHRVEGVFSGTLGYVMNELRRGRRFSEVVLEAHEKGYTEPDPRDDLGGMDVARKLLILARIAGHRLQPADIEVEPLLPQHGDLAALPLPRFLDRLTDLDDAFAERCAAAAGDGRALVYLARLEEGRARVGLESLPLGHPAAQLEGSDNIFVLQTEVFAAAPLVLRGAGAGPLVTASGVCTDLVRAARESS